MVAAGPLPGKSLVVLDSALMLAIDVFPCEDGHAQERALLDQVLATVEANDGWIEDRNFCTLGFLFGIASVTLASWSGSTRTCRGRRSRNWSTRAKAMTWRRLRKRFGWTTPRPAKP